MSKDDDRSELEKRLQQERIKELEQMRKGKIDLGKFQEVNDSLGNKIVDQQSNFTAKGKKVSGVSAGYIATQSGTGETFILKHFYKSNDDCLLEPDVAKRKQALADRKDGVRELFGSTMYQFLLYDRAPKEELVTPDKDNPKSLYVRSKFFKDVVSMADFSGDSSFNPSSSRLKKVEGFEKLVASCHMLGELDYHANNIMVQTQKDENGKDHYIFTKIDHGRSLVAFNQDFGAMINKTAESFKSFGYDQAIEDGNLSFNIDKFSQSLKQMASQFSADQIDAMVDQKIAELKKAGFDPNGLTAQYAFGNDISKQTSKPITSFEDLASTYKDLLKKNLSNMQEISNQTEIITKFTGVSETFKNGGWLQELAESPIKDPVAYAAHNNIKIEGKNALQWAYENDYKIKYTTTKEQTTEVQEKQWRKGDNDKWQEVDVTVSRTQKEVKSADPLAYIKALKKDRPLSKSELEFASQAVELGLKYTDNVTYKDVLPALKIETDANVVKEMHSKDTKVSENTLVPLIDSFVKEHLTTKTASKEDMAKFYDKVLDTLKKENYITDKEIQNMKTPAKGEKLSDFDKAVEKTLTLVKTDTPKIEGSDKMKYGVANFCKKMGCASISNYFMKKISPDNLTKIHNAEKAVSESIKLNELLKKQIGKEGIGSKRIENMQAKVSEKIETRAQKQKKGGVSR